jgi:hypothetical protein
MNFHDFVVEVHDHLEDRDVPHAFGGALALAYIAEPRGTVDVDINVFSPHELDAILAVFAEIELRPDEHDATRAPMAGIRLQRSVGSFPVDVFPPLDVTRYSEIARRCVLRPFGSLERLLPFLSAEDLTVFKLSFGRAKDWVDLRNICRARRNLDVDYIEEVLVALRGPHMHPRIARLRMLLREDPSP